LNASINLANAEDDVIVESIGWVTPESTLVDSIPPRELVEARSRLSKSLGLVK
jgi:hypothetical protein